MNPANPASPQVPPQMQRCLEGMTVGYMSKIVQNHRNFRPLKKPGSIFTAQTTKSWVICEWTTETHLPFMGNFRCLACVLQRIYHLQAIAKNQNRRLSSFRDGPYWYSTIKPGVQRIIWISPQKKTSPWALPWHFHASHGAKVLGGSGQRDKTWLFVTEVGKHHWITWGSISWTWGWSENLGCLKIQGETLETPKIHCFDHHVSDENDHLVYPFYTSMSTQKNGWTRTNKR